MVTLGSWMLSLFLFGSLCLVFVSVCVVLWCVWVVGWCVSALWYDWFVRLSEGEGCE